MLIFLIVFILSLFVFFRTLSYGIFEIKQNSNTFGGIVTIVIAVVSLICPVLVVFINGSY